MQATQTWPGIQASPPGKTERVPANALQNLISHFPAFYVAAFDGGASDSAVGWKKKRAA
jgi:hypothetical protein